MSKNAKTVKRFLNSAKGKVVMEDEAEIRKDSAKAVVAILNCDKNEFIGLLRDLKTDFKILRNSLLSSFMDYNKDFVLISGQLVAATLNNSEDNALTDEEIRGKIKKINESRKRAETTKEETRETVVEKKEPPKPIPVQLTESISLTPSFPLPTEIKLLSDMGLRPMTTVVHSPSVSNYEDDEYTSGMKYDSESGRYFTESEFDRMMKSRGYEKLGRGSWHRTSDGGVDETVYRGVDA
jgi:hypothetical protein